MSYKDIERRLRALETETPADPEHAAFVADLIAGGYTIGGVAVDQAEFQRRMPPGPFYVDIGDDDDASCSPYGGIS